MAIKLGAFVKVGNNVGVVVGLPDQQTMPDTHLAVWYGEITSQNTPRVRTVPEEYCIFIHKREFYH